MTENMSDFPYLPHTERDIDEMMNYLNIKDINELYQDVPQLFNKDLNLPSSLSELEVKEKLFDLSDFNKNIQEFGIFRGAGVYNHYIPTVVYSIASNRNFLTAYTPYQAEVSQGTLQILFEYQTLICELTGMEVANSSMYDGASALAEAILMAKRINGRNKVLISDLIHPEYYEVTKTYIEAQDMELIEIIHNHQTAQIDIQDLKNKISKEVSCVVVSYPNFFGVIEDLQEIRENVPEDIILIVSTYPISLGLLESPGCFGVDIVVGEGQSLGNLPSFGGPGLGFFASKEKYIRKMPGRIIGETVDKDGKRGFVMVLQTREQHIRRERSTSNICSNQAHNALLASIYLNVMGEKGLKEVALQCYHKAHYLANKLLETDKFEMVYQGPFFNEFVMKSKIDPVYMNKKLIEQRYFGPLPLKKFFPQKGDQILFSVTELNKKRDIDFLCSFLEGLS
ncbi:MAG TPA: aminomethyl-transferring glycine dehydrogenase subunit GcvPA [Defluviitoga tunisiensis]|nr:aminomethyl-transferring glycine dehydrogenase subunit GcvPA [Defluviitoga tunisiensis]